MDLKKAVFVFVVLVALSGCMIRPNVYVDGQPIVDNVMYGEDVGSQIKTRAVFSRTYGVMEDDEELVQVEYINPVKLAELPNDTKSVSFDLAIINESRKYYNVVAITARRWGQTTLIERVHVYQGHLSYKQFHFDLPTDLKGGEHVEFYLRFEDLQHQLMFMTLRARYWINTVPTS